MSARLCIFAVFDTSAVEGAPVKVGVEYRPFTARPRQPHCGSTVGRCLGNVHWKQIISQFSQHGEEQEEQEQDDDGDLENKVAMTTMVT